MARERKSVAIVDKQTGEVLDVEVLLIGKDRLFADKGFVKFFTAFLRDVVEDKEISGKAGRLLLWIAYNLKSNDLTIYIHPAMVAKELGVTRRSVEKWLKLLLDKGYLQKIATHLYELKAYSIVRGKMYEARKDELDF